MRIFSFGFGYQGQAIVIAENTVKAMDILRQGLIVQGILSTNILFLESWDIKEGYQIICED